MELSGSSRRLAFDNLLRCMITAFIMTHISKMDLASDPIYQERLKRRLGQASGWP